MSPEILPAALAAVSAVPKIANPSVVNFMAKTGVANAISHTAAASAGVLGAAMEMGINVLPTLGVVGLMCYGMRNMYQGVLGGPSQEHNA